MNKFPPLLFACFLFAQNLDAQVDTVPPGLVCKNQITIAINPLCFVTVGAEFFLDTVYDNSQSIDLGIRKRCTGSGFPQKNQINFDAFDLGDQTVELWAQDESGNTSSCLISVYIGDGVGNCDAFSHLYFQTLLEEGLDSVFATISGSNCLFDSIDYEILAYKADWAPSFWQGTWSGWGGFAPSAGYNFSITPSKNDDPLNGVTEDDLKLIYKHILGIEPFDSPYKIIAADANQDGKVTKHDIILLHQLILGLIDELPNGKSWRFVPYEYAFPNPQNPFQPPFPEKIMVLNTEDPVPNYFGFKGIKIGDVNFSADPN